MFPSKFHLLSPQDVGYERECNQEDADWEDESQCSCIDIT